MRVVVPALLLRKLVTSDTVGLNCAPEIGPSAKVLRQGSLPRLSGGACISTPLGRLRLTRPQELAKNATR
jgi:hypothetical protein